MNTHFNSFTPEAMRAFGQELTASARHRTEFINNTRNETKAMLTSFRKEHRDAETNRLHRAEHDADSRRLFMSELKSGVHSLLGRFELNRKQMVGEHQKMARELHETSDAFKKRSIRPASMIISTEKNTRGSNRGSNARSGNQQNTSSNRSNNSTGSSSNSPSPIIGSSNSSPSPSTDSSKKIIL